LKKYPLEATLAPMHTVGLKTLKNKLSEYARLAASGETVVITDRNRIVAKFEAATPSLVIENLHIHGVLRRPGTPLANALDAGLDVIGFRNNDKTAAAKP